jgi:hypothetical protein
VEEKTQDMKGGVEGGRGGVEDRPGELPRVEVVPLLDLNGRLALEGAGEGETGLPGLELRQLRSRGGQHRLHLHGVTSG